MLKDLETDCRRLLERFQRRESAAVIHTSVGYSRKWIYNRLKQLEESEDHPSPPLITIGRIQWHVTNSPETARAATSLGGLNNRYQFP
jgi:hypothetical protein